MQEDMPTNMLIKKEECMKKEECNQRKRKQDLSDTTWLSKKLLLEKKPNEPQSIKEPEVPKPIVDPEMWDNTQVDVFDEASKIGMKAPLPEHYESFLRWLEMRKKREIAQYIDLTQLTEPAKEKVVVDLDDSDNDI